MAGRASGNFNVPSPGKSDLPEGTTLDGGIADPASFQDFFYDLPKDFDLNQSKYDFKYRVFPSDLGEQTYNGHYMVINVNVQNGTRFGDSVVNQEGQTVNTFKVIDGELSKVDSLKFNIDEKWKAKDGPLNTTARLPRNTRRIVESIALYMPNTVAFDTNNDYEDVGLTDIGRGAAGSATSMMQAASGFVPGAGKAIGNIIGAGSRIVGGIAGGIGTGSKLLQRPINPRIEVLFRNTLQRTFQFDFLFAPENPEDSRAMQQIIKTLRFHAAPEYQNGTFSFMYIPPSEFDITFYNKGKENTVLPRINTCALTKINVDYAPHGVYSTFRDGYPVSCRLQMEFRELEVVSKLRVLQGF